MIGGTKNAEKKVRVNIKIEVEELPDTYSTTKESGYWTFCLSSRGLELLNISESEYEIKSDWLMQKRVLCDITSSIESMIKEKLGSLDDIDNVIIDFPVIKDNKACRFFVLGPKWFDEHIA